MRGLGGLVLEALSDLFECGESGSGAVVLVGLGELGRLFTDEQDERAVGSDGVDAAVVGSSCAPSVAVFEPVVRPAHRCRVVLVGAASVGVGLVVVDLGTVGGYLAAGVGAGLFEQGGGDAGVAGEQSFALSEIDHC
jgi:hypothetical protein